MAIKRSSRSKSSSRKYSRMSSSRKSSSPRSSAKRSSRKRMSMKKKLAFGAAGGLAALIAGRQLYKQREPMKQKASGFWTKYFGKKEGTLNESGKY